MTIDRSPKTSSKRRGKLFKQAVVRMGRTLPELSQYKALMEEVGFVKVQGRFCRRASNGLRNNPKMKDLERLSQQIFASNGTGS